MEPESMVIPLKEFVDREFANLRRDMDLLNTTIEKTATAHEKSHDRDHHQTELAVSKAENNMTEILNQMKAEVARNDADRRKDIQAIQNYLSNLQGRIWTVGAAFAVIVILVGYLVQFA